MATLSKLVRQGNAALRAGELDDAMDAYAQVLAADPNHLEAGFNQARALAALQDAAGALEVLDRLVAAHSGVAEIHIGRGNLLLQLERFAEAANAYRDGLQLRSDVSALRNLAMACERGGQLSEGEDAYKRALAESPKDAKTLELYGRFAVRRGNSKQAVELFERGCRIDENNAELHFQWGTALSDELRYEDALKAYNRADELAPNTPNVLYNIGHLQRLLRRWDASIESFRKVIELRPDHTKSYLEMALSLGQCGNFNRAEELVLFALEIDARDAESLLCMAKVKQLQGDFESATGFYERAAEARPDDAQVWVQCGEAHARCDDVEEAERCYRVAIEREPDSPAGYRQLVRLLTTSSRIEEARAILEQWRQRLPNDATAIHFESALQTESPQRAAAEYVVAEFDGFAERFEETLKKLDYRAPQLVGEALTELVGDDTELHILDAGCGTGLCGNYLKPLSQRLVGVDLSSKMLAEARPLGIYSSLVVAELTTFMGEHLDAFDAVVSADTLVYIGDLPSVFRAAKQALRLPGYFVFTVEELDAQRAEVSYELMLSGRFAHSDTYVLRSLEEAGFDVKSNAPVHLRNEAGAPVMGRLYAATRKPGFVARLLHQSITND